ncbi:MAG: PLP-dependent aminotransferase family protein [Chlorobia bacterium]|nr:PLP-dependent aminotransferase family protein [Fimbriimonadaceae bacterium]
MAAIGHRLYEQVAGRVRDQITRRTYRPGDRLPSVRELSRAYKVSITTVLDAYRLLEDQGFIHPRPQSGHYVRSRPSAMPSEPDRTQPKFEPAEFRREVLLEQMMIDAYRDGVTSLAFATPNPGTRPVAKLNRITAQVIRDMPTEAYGYMESGGYPPLKEQIAQRLFEAGCAVSPNEIVITSGCQEALVLALQSACKPGGVVAVESPCYYGVLLATRLAGLKAVEIETRSREGMCVSRLEEALAQAYGTSRQIQAVMLSTNFGNPLGGQLSDVDKQRLVAICQRYEASIIEDDIYGDLGFDDARPSVAKAYDENDTVLLCSSFSKTLSPGMRIGWVISGKHRSSIERAKYAMNIGAASLPQLVIAEFLSNGGYDHYLRRSRKSNESSIRHISESICRHFPSESKITRPLGGFVLWVELPHAVNTIALYGKTVEKGVTFTPGILFSAHDQYRNFLRINASRWDHEVERAISIIGHCARAMMA